MSKKASTSKSQKKKTMAETADSHVLYERSVQCTESSIEVIDLIYEATANKKPRFLREDFCGTAKLCADWVESDEKRRATGVDLHRPTLDWAFAHNIAPLSDAAKQRVSLVEADVLNCQAKNFDVIAAFNFSYWVFKDRETIKRYFKRVKECLAKGGLFLLDIYGGPDSQFVMEEEADHGDYSYVWDQALVDPINNHIICHIHFRFPDGSALDKAFTYDWRLWSMPELRDILFEVGFTKVDAWWDCEDDVIRLKTEAENLISWVGYLAAWR
jgi:SAM-dependent methyltransferase